jgi:NADPH-dependent 2,4-dienoyl-CoA reductase/sulfur reductase-like enzyme
MATTPESKNFFLQEKAKKLPKYLRDAPSIPVKNVSVIGAGVMGAGIAQLCAHKGLSVYMKVISTIASSE